MAGREIANELSRFNTDVEQFKTALDDLDNNYTNVFETIESLNSTWAGQAHDAFLTQFDNDNKNVKDMIEELKKYRDDLLFANNEYTKCEAEVNDIVTSLSIG